MADLKEIASDPVFQKLPLPEQMKAFSEMDPAFASLPSVEQERGIRELIGRNTVRPAQPQQQPGFFAGVGRGLATVAGGVGQRLGAYSQQDVDAAMSAMNEEQQQSGFAGKAGQFVGQAAPYMLMPGGGATVLGRMGVNALTGSMAGYFQPTAEGESAGKNALTGAAVGGGVSGALSAAVKLAPQAGKLVRETFGMTTGSGPGAAEEALKGGKAFQDALRGNISGEDVVNTAKTALNTIKNKRGTEYRELLGKVTANKEPIDLNEIKTSVTENLKNFVKYTEDKAMTGGPVKAAGELSVVPHPSGGGFAVKKADGELMRDARGAASFYRDKNIAQGTVDFIAKKSAGDASKAAAAPENPVRTLSRFNWSRTSVGDIKTSKDAKELKAIFDKVNNWGGQPGDNTAVELDRLRRDLDNFYSDSSRVRSFVAHARDTVNKAIVKNVPEYAEMTKGYSEATKLIKDIESGLMMRKQGMTGRVVADQTLRRLTSAMKENFELRNDLVKVLGQEGGQDVAGQIAGYSMNQLVPHGLVGKLSGGSMAALAYVHPKMWPVLAASSPRIVGEFLLAFGKAQRAAAKAIPASVTSKAASIIPKAAAVAATQPDNKKWKNIGEPSQDEMDSINK